MDLKCRVLDLILQGGWLRFDIILLLHVGLATEEARGTVGQS